MNSFRNGVIKLMTNISYRPIWLSETGTDWCSCAYNLTATFADGFFWLDKLGSAAFYGIEKVFRQDIYGSSFALINEKMKPYPDYWLTFLYKKLVGNQVFEVSTDLHDENLRLYASSSKKGYFVRYEKFLKKS